MNVHRWTSGGGIATPLFPAQNKTKIDTSFDMLLLLLFVLIITYLLNYYLRIVKYLANKMELKIVIKSKQGLRIIWL